MYSQKNDLDSIIISRYMALKTNLYFVRRLYFGSQTPVMDDLYYKQYVGAQESQNYLI